MTLLHFIGLSLQEQADQVWQGKFITSRIEGGLYVLLYRVDDFYAEVFYDPAKHAITQVKGFNAKSHLLPYLL